MATFSGLTSQKDGLLVLDVLKSCSYSRRWISPVFEKHLKKNQCAIGCYVMPHRVRDRYISILPRSAVPGGSQRL